MESLQSLTALEDSAPINSAYQQGSVADVVIEGPLIDTERSGFTTDQAYDSGTDLIESPTSTKLDAEPEYASATPPDEEPSSKPNKKNHRIGRTIAALSMAGAALASLVGCEPLAPSAKISYNLEIIGDSLSASALNYLNFYNGDSVLSRAAGGASPCNALGALQSDANIYAPKVVELQFSGNMSSCMAGEDPTTAYERDITTIANFWRSHGASVYIELSPKTSTDSEAWARNVEISVGEKLGIPINNAGLADEDSNGNFTWYLPCLPWETYADGCGYFVPGLILVRNYPADSIHFYTMPNGYSGGALRFALAETYNNYQQILTIQTPSTTLPPTTTVPTTTTSTPTTSTTLPPTTTVPTTTTSTLP